MPGSGVPLLWNENAPAETDIADAAPIRSLETSLRNGLAVEHNWPNASAPNFGYHLLGSARAYYDTQSNASSSGTDGRLLVASDTSRLFHVGSGGTMYLGDARALSAGSVPVGGQRFYWATEFGIAQTAANGHLTVAYGNSGYSGNPFVMVAVQDTAASSLPFFVNLQGIPGPLTFAVETFNNGAQASNVTFHWFSIGTRTF